jgi:hypothetical protein
VIHRPWRGHAAAGADQGVDGFVGLAGVGGDGADAGEGVPQAAAGA